MNDKDEPKRKSATRIQPQVSSIAIFTHGGAFGSLRQSSVIRSNRPFPSDGAPGGVGR